MIRAASVSVFFFSCLLLPSSSCKGALLVVQAFLEDEMAAVAPDRAPLVPIDAAPMHGLEAFIIREQDISICGELARGTEGVVLNAMLPAVAKVRSPCSIRLAVRAI